MQLLKFDLCYFIKNINTQTFYFFLRGRDKYHFFDAGLDFSSAIILFTLRLYDSPSYKLNYFIKIKCFPKEWEGYGIKEL